VIESHSRGVDHQSRTGLIYLTYCRTVSYVEYSNYFDACFSFESMAEVRACQFDAQRCVIYALIADWPRMSAPREYLRTCSIRRKHLKVFQQIGNFSASFQTSFRVRYEIKILSRQENFTL